MPLLIYWGLIEEGTNRVGGGHANGKLGTDLGFEPRCLNHSGEPACGLLQEVIIDVRLICPLHLDQANGAFCNAEDRMVNIDIGPRHFNLKFCHGRTTSRHDRGLEVLQGRRNQ